MQAPLPHPDLDSPPSSSSPPRPRRSPPPGHYDWQPFAIEYKTPLPVLPPIRDLALAAQARTTKQYLAWQDGRKGTHEFTDEDEARSFRRLEWVGDGVLHDLYAVALYRLFPRAKSDLLSRMRGAVASNNVHSYLGWQYRLDERILEPPVAAGGKLARPFREVQVYSADLSRRTSARSSSRGAGPRSRTGSPSSSRRRRSRSRRRSRRSTARTPRAATGPTRSASRRSRAFRTAQTWIPSPARAASRTSPTAARRPRVL